MSEIAKVERPAPRLYTRRDLAKLATVGLIGCSLEGQASGHSRGLLGVRGAMMEGGKALPYAWQAQYIEFTGSQYFDIEKAASLSSYVCLLDVTSGSADGGTLYATTMGRIRVRVMKYPYGSGTRFHTCIFSWKITDGYAYGDYQLTVSFDRDGQNYSISCGDTVLQELSGRSAELGLLRIGCDYDLSNFATNNVRRIRIASGGVATADLIPVCGLDGVPYFYDRVDGSFYRSAGSDDFVLGPKA